MSWQKQTVDEPLFSDLLWSRPENKRFAGSLLIVGGNLHGFAIPATAYQIALNSGVGEAKVLLPDALKKAVGKIFEHGEYLPSTSSGSFAKIGLGSLLEYAERANGTLIVGELGKNSETSMLFESFVDKYNGRLTVANDSSDYFLSNADVIIDRPNTMVVFDMSQLQKFASSLKSTVAFVSSMNLPQLAKALSDFTKIHESIIIVKHLENIWVAFNGKVSSTKLDNDEHAWQIETATKALVWWIQHPEKPYEAVTSSLVTD